MLRGSAPAELWRITDCTTGGNGKVGVIPSGSQLFCSTCDRTRFTADGHVRSCLFATEETDLRGLLRGGADDAAIEATWRAAMWASRRATASTTPTSSSRHGRRVQSAAEVTAENGSPVRYHRAVFRCRGAAAGSDSEELTVRPGATVDEVVEGLGGAAVRNWPACCFGGLFP